MASYNKIQITGKLSDTPDIKATTSGHSLSKFTLIVPRIDALPNQRFDYIRVTAWRDNADKTSTYKKDDIIYVEGRIITDSYEDASSGQRKWTTEVDAKNLVNFNEVFQDANAIGTSTESPSLNDASFDAPPIETIPTPTFLDTAPVEESKNDLEEDVPF